MYTILSGSFYKKLYKLKQDLRNSQFFVDICNGM